MLFFIDSWFGFCPDIIIVSIHLMLFFIKHGKTAKIEVLRFQYISCYSLSVYHIKSQGIYSCFNTSHVILYRYTNVGKIRCIDVSIHLMLFFIPTGYVRGTWTYMFQYISCYSLSNLPQINLPCDWVSIHLMLFFILALVPAQAVPLPFQYISCYSLSFFFLNSFCKSSQFQYISCYSLSYFEGIGASANSLFQYISCYSLSPRFSILFHANFLYNIAKYKDLQHFSQVM